jgi:uncharacterized protein
MTVVAQPNPAELRAPAHRVSVRATAFWTVRAVVGWVPVITLVALFALLPDNAGTWRSVVLAVAGAVAVAHVVVMPRWRYRVHRWETTPAAVYTQSGWFLQERRIAPVSRIQTVDMERGPIEQLFALANVTVTTASAAGPLRIHGLDVGTAQSLVDELTRRTQAVPGDAT